MKKRSLPAFLLLSVSCLIVLLPLAARSQENFSYEEAWKKTDSLALEGLPRSAYSEVEKIYDRARLDKDPAMLVKAVIHRMLFQAYIEEDSFAKIITGLEKDLRGSVFPVKPVLHSLLAETYWKYYEQNRRRLFERSTVADTSVNDFRSWDYERLLREVTGHYRLSLAEKDKQQRTAVDILEGVLKGQKESRFLRPTLYDLLAHRAADFYMKEESNLTPRPEENYFFNKPALFADAVTFADAPLNSPDRLSLALKGLELLQELTRFHLQDTDPSALVAVELKRLEYLHDRSRLPRKDSLYVRALRKLGDMHTGIPIYSEVAYALAHAYFEMNSLSINIYNKRPVINLGQGDSSGYVKAAAICREAIGKHPQSLGAGNCRALLSQILEKELKVKAEDTNPPGEPFRLLVSYRNLPEAYFRVVKLWRNEIDSVTFASWDRHSPARQRALKLLLSKPPAAEYHHRLPGTEDHYKHSTELKIDALPAGNYAILASETENFRGDSALLAFTTVTVSEIGAIHREQGLLQEIYVTGRKSGKPIENASVLVYKKVERSGNAREERLEKTLVSDENGKISFKAPENMLYSVLAAKGRDTLEVVSNNWAWKRRQNRAEDREKTVFFTDRKVYRPGQTVHFKGFLFFSGEQPRIWPRKRTEVSFFDPNDEEISVLQLISNEFGTFSGSFIIPENGLPGRMKIENEYGSAWIEVAEYKRPTFEVSFKPVSEIFRLNDSAHVSGIAQSFSGYPIDRAQVAYTVTRTSRFQPLRFQTLNGFQPRNRYIYPPESPLQIASGLLQTDSEGGFSVAFLAEARDTSGIYSYQVNAHVTDPNGETRSGSTALTIANRQLQVSAGFGTEIYTENPLDFEVSARNLNGEIQEVDMQLRIHALVPPLHLLRQRLWEAPDEFIMSREDYKKAFPHDAYDGEHDYRNWEPGKKCLETTFHADSIETLQLNRLKKCKPGWYLAEISATTAEGETATQQYYFNLLHKTPGLPQTTADFIAVLKNSVSPGESAEFLVGGAGPETYVLYEIHSEGKVREQRWIKTGARQEKISVPVAEGAARDLAVQFTIVHENRVYNELHSVQVVLPEKKLDIEMLSFRDKTRPGEKESWTVKISSAEGEKVMAEMVATLYDASLDDIKPHSWLVNDFIPYRRAFLSLPWNTGGFLQESRESILRRGPLPLPYTFRVYERLKDYGYDYYGGYNASYRNYLRQLNRKKRLERLQKAWEEAFSQQSEMVKEGLVISGTITDKDGNPLPGVTVAVKGVASGVYSNIKGEYKVKVPPGGVLVFSFIGFETQEITPGSDTSVDVSLEGDASALDEVVVVGYGSQKKAALTGRIMIRGISAAAPQAEDALEEPADSFATAGPETGTGTAGDGLQDLVPRKDFRETAFFYPHLYTNEEGKISLEFTIPESITRWKMLGFAHTKDFLHGSISKELVTSKEVSATANAPRFVRTGDRMAFTAKVVNLTENPMEGQARLLLMDALTLEPVDSLLLRQTSHKAFKLEKHSSTTLSWEIAVPEGLQALTYRVLAGAGAYTDGEEKTIPVLPNSILVTETLPLQIEAGETAEFSISSFPGSKLPAARPYRFTLEFTSNPAWYAVQSLPYLMEFPYECAEQLFSRYFANSLAASILNSSPRIKAVFGSWKNTDSNELLSALEKNQELKSALREETPWVLQSKNETERKKRLALLFDLNNMRRQNQAALRKLAQMQLPDGSFPWFSGMRGSRFITQHILAGLGQLNHLGALPLEDPGKREDLVRSALRYADGAFSEDFKELQQRLVGTAGQGKAPGREPGDRLNAFIVHFLYMRSFFPQIKPGENTQKAIDFYLDQAEEYWLQQTIYQQGLIALTLQRHGRAGTALKIIRSLRERAQISEEKGMYWVKNRRGYFWQEAPIETQALLIEAFTEVSGGSSQGGRASSATRTPSETSGETKDARGASASAGGESASPKGKPGFAKEVEQMKKWLLLNKRTNNWQTTKATVAACYALLLRGANLLEAGKEAGITVGGKPLETLKPGLKKEAGTGYLKTSWEAGEIGRALEDIRISNPGEVVSWGGLYFQYFEKPENIPASGEGLSIRKTLYRETLQASGPVLVPLNEGQPLKPGDLVKVRLELRAERDYEYIHLKDLRAAAFEPTDILASYRYQDGLGYYQAPRNASMNFFISRLPRGNYVLEYSLRVTHAGTFSNGFANVQCMYAPEFSARSDGMRIEVAGPAPR